MKGKLVFACAAGFKILIFCYNMLLNAVVVVQLSYCIKYDSIFIVNG